MELVGKRRTVALVVVLAAAFMDLLDVTVLNVALPSVERELAATSGQTQWVLSGYTLAFALSIVTGARLGDLLGRARVFRVGLAGFAAASAWCGLAESADMLVASRAVQGVFAGVMVPQVLAQIQVLYRPEERGGPMAAFSAMTGLAACVGPVLGAVLTETALPEITLPALGAVAVSGWRLIFWLNVPVGILALLAAHRTLPESRSTRTAPGLDLVGIVLGAVGLLLLLAPLTLGVGATPPAWAPLPMAVGAGVLVGFVVHQRRRATAGRPVALEVGLFQVASLRAGLATQMLFFIPIMGFFLVFMQFLQLGLGRSPLTAGLIMLPWSVTVAVAAALAATVLLPRLGRLTVQLGLVALGAGFALLAVAALTMVVSSFWWLLPGLLVGAAGMGLVVAPLAQLTLAEVPGEHAGAASALFNTNAQLSASIGVTVLGTVFFAAAQPSPEGAHLAPALAISLAVAVALLAAALASTWWLPRPPTTRSSPPYEPRPGPAAVEGARHP